MLTVLKTGLVPASGNLEVIRKAEQVILEQPQECVITYHTLHSGVYTRTIYLKKGQVIAGAFIKIPTTLIVIGNLNVSIGEEFNTLVGTHILIAIANRKQIMVANEDSTIIMVFKTMASTIEEAEYEFTDEVDNLASRLPTAINYIKIGEQLCQE